MTIDQSSVNGYTNTLLPHHAALLSASAIAPHVIQARGYESIVQAAQLNEYGFSKIQRIAPTLLIPSWSVFKNATPTLYQHRPDMPRLSAAGKPIKYEIPAKSTIHIDVNPLIRHQLANPNIPIYFTEGIRKADAAISVGLCCVALLGVWGWRSTNEFGGTIASPDLDQIALNDGRISISVFDSDIMQNQSVFNALIRFKSLLEQRGSRFHVIYLPSGPNGEKVGLDDYLATHPREELESLITTELREPPSLDTSKPVNGYRLSELGNSERLADAHHESLRFVNDLEQWYTFDGKIWKRNATGEVSRITKSVVRGLYKEADDLSDDDQRRALTKFALQSESAKSINAIKQLAQSDIRIATIPRAFDSHPFLLTCNNGTIDLQTGQLLPHNSHDLITRLAPVDFNQSLINYFANPSPIPPDGTTATRSDSLSANEISAINDWLTFLNLVTSNNQHMIDFLQRTFGYCLTGSTREGSIFYVHGESRTGKTTIVEALLAILGMNEYGYKTSFDTFLASRRAGGPRNDLASLEGIRLSVASEVSSGQKFNEALLKELSGEDSINVRHLYKNETIIKPQFKLFFTANDFPHIGHTDSGSWNRIKIIKFDNLNAASREYLDLKQRVRDPQQTGAVILAWAVQGCLSWLSDGSLSIPDAVLEATEAQRSEFDPLGEWLATCVKIGPSESALFDHLWSGYTYFMDQDRHAKALSRKGFAKSLVTHGFTDNPGEIRIFKGLSVPPPAP